MCVYFVDCWHHRPKPSDNSKRQSNKVFIVRTVCFTSDFLYVTSLASEGWIVHFRGAALASMCSNESQEKVMDQIQQNSCGRTYLKK